MVCEALLEVPVAVALEESKPKPFPLTHRVLEEGEARGQYTIQVVLASGRHLAFSGATRREARLMARYILA